MKADHQQKDLNPQPQGVPKMYFAIPAAGLSYSLNKLMNMLTEEPVKGDSEVSNKMNEIRRLILDGKGIIQNSVSREFWFFTTEIIGENAWISFIAMAILSDYRDYSFELDFSSVFNTVTAFTAINILCWTSRYIAAQTLQSINNPFAKFIAPSNLQLNFENKQKEN